MRNWKKSLILVAIGFLILGGCRMFGNREEILTKEQQDKIAKYVVNKYEGVKKIEFEEVNENKFAGTIFVNLKINDNNYLTISLGKDIADMSNYSPGWNPKTFKLKETKENQTNINTVKIIYLGE